MLFLKRTMLLLVLCASSAAVTAQQKKIAPPAFERFSASINVSESDLSTAVKLTKGQQAQINFGNELNFSGVVMSNIQVFDNLQTIIIKSPAYNNALLQISRQVLDDKSITYVGRIFSEGSADGYHLKRANNGAYSLQKYEAAVLKQDCAL